MTTIVDIPVLPPLHFGIRLRSERKRLGLSQVDLGKAGGVSRYTQYLYEQGDRYPTMEYIIKIINLGADLGYLATGIRTPVSHKKARHSDQAVLEIMTIVDELARDPKGRLLDLEYRLSLASHILEYINNVDSEDIDWPAVNKVFRDIQAR